MSADEAHAFDPREAGVEHVLVAYRRRDKGIYHLPAAGDPDVPMCRETEKPPARRSLAWADDPNHRVCRECGGFVTCVPEHDHSAHNALRRAAGQPEAAGLSPMGERRERGQSDD